MYRELEKNLSFENNHLMVALIGNERFFANNYGISIFDYIFDIKNMLSAEKKAFKDFKKVLFIPGVWPDYGAGVILPSMVGSKISWFDDLPPAITEPIIKNIKDIKNIKFPNCEKDGLGPWYFKALKRFIRDSSFKDDLHFNWSIGPGEFAGFVLGLDNFFVNMYEDPLNTKKVLSLCTDIIINFLEVQFSINKSSEGFLLTDDIAGLISKDFYEEFLLPFHIKIRDSFREKIFILHNDTKSDHIIDSLVNIEIDVFNFGPTTDLNILIDKMLRPKKVVLMGNIDPTGVLLSKDKDFIREIVRKLLKKIGSFPGFIISAGGGLNATEPDIINLLIEEVESFNNRDGE